MKSRLFPAVAVIVGTIVGAGIFAVPYAVSRVGFPVGLLFLFILGLVSLLICLCYGEVISRTKGEMEVTGYVNRYLGKWGKRILTVSITCGIYGALLVYMIGVGKFAYELLGKAWGGSPELYSVIFFVLASLVILLGLNMVSWVERLMFILLCGVVVFVFVMGWPMVRMNNLLTVNLNWGNLFLAYGVIFFAITGATSVRQAFRILKGEKKLKEAIGIGLLIPFLIYFFFVLVVVGVSGLSTSPEAIQGLGYFLGRWVVLVGSILGILTMTTSFLTLGLVLKDIFRYDYKINKTVAWVMACFVPLIAFLAGLSDFIKVISIVGALTTGLDGILILMAYLKAKKKGDRQPEYNLRIPKFVIYIVFGLLALGALYEIYHLL